MIALKSRSNGKKSSDFADEQLARELISESGLFDPEYYNQEYPDVAASSLEALTHFIRHGGSELRNPSAAFDAGQYAADYLDVRAAGLSPLLHYLRFGRYEGRKFRATIVRAPKPHAPSRVAWKQLACQILALPRATPVVDVIVPVYRGLDETANCLYSVLQSRVSANIPFEIVAIDDRSPEPVLSQLLDELADARLITVIRNQSNLGFVGSVNQGMKFHEDRDVILLNSDTEVYGSWVERLNKTIYRHPNIGTATPFSNNATICSYPNFNGEFHGNLEISFAELDRVASTANAGLTVDLPTAIGFCMYIRRECLNEVGLFDTNAFGRGYGEENDFCLRIAARGWRNVLAADTFVRHIGRVSFLGSTERHLRRGLEVIDRRYPQYKKEIAKFIKHDPVRDLRQNLDVARMLRVARRRPFLFVLHDLGGGTPRHVLELAALLAEAGIPSLCLQPWQGDGRYAQVKTYLEHQFVTQILAPIDFRHGLKAAVALFQKLDISHIHVHHLMGFNPEIMPFIPALAESVGVKYDFTFHDYLAVCPRVTMINFTGVYCGNNDPSLCEQCVKDDGSPFGDVSVWLWRANYERLLNGARKLFVPNEDTRAHIHQFLPELALSVRPHPEPTPKSWTKPVVRKSNEILRVAVIGAIGPHKGSLQLQRCAENAARRKLPIKFLLFGYTDRQGVVDLPNVEVTGRYAERDLGTHLERGLCHLSFFPSVWPETYSYTLSQAFFRGLFPVAFDIGAIAQRIRKAQWGLLLPIKFWNEPNAVNNALLTCKIPEVPENLRREEKNVYPNIISDYYGLERSLFERRR